MGGENRTGADRLRAYYMYRMYMSNPRRRIRRALGDGKMTSLPHQEDSHCLLVAACTNDRHVGQ